MNRRDRDELTEALRAETKMADGPVNVLGLERQVADTGVKWIHWTVLAGAVAGDVGTFGQRVLDLLLAAGTISISVDASALGGAVTYKVNDWEKLKTFDVEKLRAEDAERRLAPPEDTWEAQAPMRGRFRGRKP